MNKCINNCYFLGNVIKKNKIQFSFICLTLIILLIGIILTFVNDKTSGLGIIMINVALIFALMIICFDIYKYIRHKQNRKLIIPLWIKSNTGTQT